MFSITHIDQPSRRALIEVDSFREEFESSGDLSPQEFEDLWVKELKKIKEKESLVLPYWIKDGIASRAWIIWKEEKKAYIQDVLLTEGYEYAIESAPERETETEDGYRISEWSTDITSIISFLNRREQNQAGDDNSE